MRLRIAMISEHASPLARMGGVDAGGQNVYVAHLARNLARLGHEVDVFTRRDDPGLPTVVNWEPGVRIINVTAGPPADVPKEEMLPFMEEFTASMAAFIRSEGAPYDIAHANFFMSGMVAARLKRLLELPFVVTFHALGRVRLEHQGASDRFPPARLAIEEAVIEAADRIIAECPQDQRDLIELYDADPARISVVPCGFDPNETWPVKKDLARAMVGLPADGRVILQLGRMVPRKGVDTVIAGFARLVRGHRIDATLVVVGGAYHDGRPLATSELERLRSLARDKGVEDRVIFAGGCGRDRIKYYYSAADVFVTTPWYEPFGITPLEAMACGVPVIGSDVGGIKHTVVHGETGRLVKPKDPAAVGDALAWMFKRPVQMRVMGFHGRLRANKLFNWRRIATLALEVYARALDVPASALLPEVMPAVSLPVERRVSAGGWTGAERRAGKR